MTPENISAAEPNAAGMGEFSRIAGVFFEPGKTFADIAARPSFLLPIVLMIVAGLCSSYFIGQKIGWERMFRHQAETNSRMQQLPPDQREQTIAMQVKFASIGAYAGPIVAVPLMELIEAGILLGIVAGIMSAPVRFKQVFAVVCWAGITYLVSAILTIVVIFLKNPDDFNMQNPLAFNPAAFMDPQTSSKFAYSLASSIDLFSFWGIFLIATGLKAAAGKKLSFGGALFSVILPWGVYVLGKSALAGVFS
ncbi:MAG: YIP1 family protein [Candidatus Sulfopaludibacter sp.]|nr:YIP1 family protein [Candidatus Sulfopaludibacter sp.]